MAVQFQPTAPSKQLKDLLHRGGREQVERDVSSAVSIAFQALESCPVSDQKLYLSSRNPVTGRPTDQPMTDSLGSRCVKWLSELIRPGSTSYTGRSAGQQGQGVPVNKVT